MKVAVCVSGLMRTFQICYESLFRNIVIPNQADVFISTWSILGTGTYKVPGQPWIAIAGAEQPLNVDIVNHLYGSHLKGFHIEDWQPMQNRFYQELEESCRRSPSKVVHTENMKSITRRLISMHYKIQEANRMSKEYEEKNGFVYDVVIRARPDIRHEKMLRMENYKVIWPNVFSDLSHNYGYVCDQFAFGTRNVMDIYSSIYSKIFEYNNWLAVYNAENMMKHHLQTNGLAVQVEDLDYKVVGLIER